MKPTPFHPHTAPLNATNSWALRNGFTLATAYRDAAVEASAARTSVVVADISWRWRIVLEGGRVHDFVRRLFTRDATALDVGQAIKALWLADGGGVRGAGVVARLSEDGFAVASAASDPDWFTAAARWYSVSLIDRTERQGGLALIGPYAAKLIASLGLDSALEPLTFRTSACRNISVTLSRFGEHGGYELWCDGADAPALWDTIVDAGRPFALVAAGLDALDTLDLEAGVPRPGRDYDGATTAIAAEPLPGELRLASLIDQDHPGFNGGSAGLAATPPRKLVGIALDSERPAPFTPLLASISPVGQTLSSRYSPVLRRAIALAQVDPAHAVPGTLLQLMLPPAGGLLPTAAATRVVDLPFLPPPDVLLP